MRNIYKTLLFIPSLVLMAGAGCTQPTTTTNTALNTNSDTVITDNTNVEQGNEAGNTNEVAENTNANTPAEMSDANTNTADDSTVDTSDWLTYTNEEYGFSFKYPRDWEIKELNETTIGLISPELKAELANGPNSATSSDLVLVINQPLSETAYIVGDFVDSLETVEMNGDIRSLTFTDENSRAKFIEYNDFADVDQYSQYIKINSDTVVTSTYSMSLDNTIIFEEILSSLHSI